MEYNYLQERPTLFTIEGADTLLMVRDNAHHLLRSKGAFTVEEVTHECNGALNTRLAAVDYLIERRMIQRAPTPVGASAKGNVFVARLWANQNERRFEDVSND